MTSVMRLINKPLFMEPNQIKEAHILDILFEGRNKEYGAYELRKTYNRRVAKSLFAMVSVVGLLFIGFTVAGFSKGKKVMPPDVTDVSLLKVEEVKPPVVPPVVVPPAPRVAQIRMVTVRIVPDKEVKPDEKPPENDAANKVAIGTITRAGVEAGDLAGPPSTGEIAGVAEAPKKTEPDEPFTKVEVDADFIGGPAAWARFLNKNLSTPQDAIDNNISGRVVIRFVVDVNGNVSDVEAISGPEGGGLRAEAIRVIKRSGKWVPAIQNGRHVKAYRIQPVIFQPAE
jgi:protein TonB